MTEELKKRLLTAAVAVPILLVIIYLGGIPFLLLVVVACLAGIFELNKILAARGLNPQEETSILCGAGLVAVAYYSNELYLTIFLTLSILLILSLQMRKDVSLASSGIASTFAGVFYVGWLASHIVLVRNFGVSLRPESVKAKLILVKSHLTHDPGLFFTVLILACVFLNDTGGYTFGKKWGRHKLFPRISPNKSWEGFWGGVVTASATACLVFLIFGVRWSYFHAFAVAALVAVFGTIGDLVESLFKRSAGLKDSGTLFPGHGGMLDRLDSILFSFAVVYYYLRIVL